MNKQRFFYLKQNNRIFGPFPAAHILKLFRSNALHPEDEISVDKINWKNALQFFDVKDDTALPFELKKNNTNQITTESIPEITVRPPDFAPVVRYDNVSMRCLYIIFSAFMLITVLSGITIAILNPETVRVAPTSSKNLSGLASDNAPSIFKIDDAPSAPDIPAAPAVQTEKKTAAQTAPAQQQTAQQTAPQQPKASSAFILTLFRNIN